MFFQSLLTEVGHTNTFYDPQAKMRLLIRSHMPCIHKLMVEVMIVQQCLG